ncbi:MAG: hypothetical protein RR877_09820 [Aurantimicrobium sp.]|uniref:hypothetical protein n=1 Tax=Aurantimicrobium sp. TaxID=1930784 RepID=UPI002FCBCFBC
MSEHQSNEPTLHEKILNLYSEGADDVEVAALLNLPEKRFKELYEENSGFAKVVDIGRTKAAAWWHHVARRNLVTKGFQGSTWAMVMKNRLGWRDRVDVLETNESTQKSAELEKEIQDTMARIQNKSPAQFRQIMGGDDD